MIKLSSMRLSGADVLPLVEGGKGVAVSDGHSAGAWAATGGVGTFSGVCAKAQKPDESGYIPFVPQGRDRLERSATLLDYNIRGGIDQAKIAHDVSGGRGRIHMNVLWEIAYSEQIIIGILKGAPGLIHGLTCGAGMPYNLAKIAASFSIYYYPIVSSARAFRILWKKSYAAVPEWLGGVVYEDPWVAGGHNGISNKENPLNPEAPYGRVLEIRTLMNEIGLQHIPIIMAGGVWNLNEWKEWIDNPELGPIAFQLGTRPLLTQESPISAEWKERLRYITSPDDIVLNKFSPTGFYSSAVQNNFLRILQERSARQVAYASESSDLYPVEVCLGVRKRPFYFRPQDTHAVERWIRQGYTESMITPNNTMIFVDPEEAAEIRQSQANCKGCLSYCRFSNWATNADHTTNLKPDPRSFCIFDRLTGMVYGQSIEENLMFAGKNVYRFSRDPFYANGFIPTVQQLVDRLQTGE